MLRTVLLASLALLGFAAAPAQAGNYDLLRRASCDRPIPSGRPVPRQSVLPVMRYMGSVALMPSDTPNYRDKDIGWLRRGEPFTIVRECGDMLRIRTADGLEGWIYTAVIPDERIAHEKAKSRPPETVADCELLYLNLFSQDRCKAKFAAEQAHKDEVAHSPNLSAEELRGLVIGHTLRIAERHPGPGTSDGDILTHYAPDGQCFSMQGKLAESGMRIRTVYQLAGDKICHPAQTTYCGGVRKVGDQLVWTAPNGTEYLVKVSDGDTDMVVAEVTKRFPYPAAPPVPSGGDDVAGPVSGN